MSKVAVIYLHGQGSYKENSHDEIMENITDNIGFNSSQIAVFPVMYYSHIQDNQDDLLLRMNISRPKIVSRIRNKIISSFGDPSTIYHNEKAYDFVMQKIKYQFLLAQAYLQGSENGSLVVIAHSLGTVLISNYLWDAQQANINYQNLKLVVTTGSPMPVFISGIDQDKIEPIKKPCPNFQWLNFWNKKDALSFPYQPINNKYDELIEDIETKKGLWFYAHGSYKKDKRVYKRVAKEIQTLLKE